MSGTLDLIYARHLPASYLPSPTEVAYMMETDKPTVNSYIRTSASDTMVKYPYVPKRE